MRKVGGETRTKQSKAYSFKPLYPVSFRREVALS
jgi:hypothetical protein